MEHMGRGVATVGICGAGAYSMYISGGQTGIGWSVLGILLIWGIPWWGQ